MGIQMSPKIFCKFKSFQSPCRLQSKAFVGWPLVPYLVKCRRATQTTTSQCYSVTVLKCYCVTVLQCHGVKAPTRRDQQCAARTQIAIKVDHKASSFHLPTLSDIAIHLLVAECFQCPFSVFSVIMPCPDVVSSPRRSSWTSL